MNKSTSITNLSKALSAAQGEMPVVKMNATNPFLKNKYADLGAVIEASRPVLSKNGLSISQFPTSDGDRIGLTSILSHASGEWIEETISLPLSDSKGLSVAQASGVVISYLRRYSWASMLGLYADEDTDGHIEGTKKEEKKPEQPAPAKKPATHVEIMARWEELWKKSQELGIIVVPLAPKLTDAEIIGRGMELHDAIIKAEKKVVA